MSTELEAIASMPRPERARQIALGLDKAFNKLLAALTGAADYTQWESCGITRRTVRRRFGRAFHQAVQRAEHIHFALDGLDDLAEAIHEGRFGFCRGNFTNAELRAIVLEPRLSRKTTFYRGVAGHSNSLARATIGELDWRENE